MKSRLTIPLVLASLILPACSKDTGEVGGEAMLPQASVSPTPTPPPAGGVPLDPMEAWCESMMSKPNLEWSKEDAKKFSNQCLYDNKVQPGTG